MVLVWSITLTTFFLYIFSLYHSFLHFMQTKCQNFIKRFIHSTIQAHFEMFAGTTSDKGTKIWPSSTLHWHCEADIGCYCLPVSFATNLNFEVFWDILMQIMITKVANQEYKWQNFNVNKYILSNSNASMTE